MGLGTCRELLEEEAGAWHVLDVLVQDAGDAAQLRGALRAVALDEPQERVDDGRVELGAATAEELSAGELDTLRRLVGTATHDHLERIGGRDDVGLYRHEVAAKLVGVSLAVVVFVMGAHDRHEVAERLDRVDDRRTEDRMRAHDHPLVLGQGGGLIQDRVGYPDLADVVKERAELHSADLIGREIHLLGDAPRERGNAGGVAPRVRIASVDRRRERANGRQVELPHPPQRLGVLECGRDKVPERLQDCHILVVVRVLVIRAAREDTHKLAAALHRDVHLGAGPAQLSAQDHLACRIAAQRDAVVAGTRKRAARGEDELELLRLVVEAGYGEGVAPDEGPGSFECQLRDREWLVHCRKLPRQNVQGGETSDASLALAALVGGAKCAPRELREGREALPVDDVEGAIGVGRCHRERRANVAIDDNRSDHRRVDPGGVRKDRDRSALLGWTFGEVIAEDHELAGADGLA